LYEFNKETFILCICISDDKLYVYTDKGILKKRILYKNIAKDYGKPISISENGQYLIFRENDLDGEINLLKIDLN